MKYNKLLVIDTFGLIHRAYHAYPLLTTSDGRFSNAIFGFIGMLMTTIEKFEPDCICCSLESESPTFRHKILTDYKANRKETESELSSQINEIINIIQTLKIQTLHKEGYEADDVIGSFAMQNRQNFKEICIVTGDRDLLQLIDGNISVYMPGRTFSDLVKYDCERFKDRFGIELEDYVLYKALVGDTSDNIKGIPGIGPKTASQIVNKFHSVDAILANLDDLPPRIAEGIQESSTLLQSYYDTCKIETEIKLDIDIENTTVSKMDVNKLRKVIDEFELKSLSNRIAKFIDKHQKKYDTFDLFGGNDVKEVELKVVIADKVRFDNQTAYILTIKDGYRFGNGIEFVDIKVQDLYNFVTLNKINKFIGFELKQFIKELIICEFNIQKFEFIDLKISWTLLNHTLDISSINDLVKYLSVTDIQRISDLTDEKIKTAKYQNLVKLDNECQSVIAEMELNGIYCDKEKLIEISTGIAKQVEDIKKKMFESIGFEFNPASTRDLGHVLFEVLKLPVFKKNKTGFSTDDSTLDSLEDLHELIPLIRRFRSLAKFNSTYLVGYQDYIDEKGLIHSTFNQTQVATGRLSSTNPNLQNIPRDEELGGLIKQAFCVRNKGNILLSLDYSQIDLRVMAYVTKDKGLINAFTNDLDIHMETAKAIFDKEEISKEERSFAKTINFGIIYGMEPYGLSQALKIDQATAKEFINRYFEKYTNVNKYFEEITKQLDEFGYVKTFLGRKRYFNTWKVATGSVRRALIREAVNMPIQGGTSEIMKIAMVEIDKFIKSNKLSAKLILQIHDELVFEVEKSELDNCKFEFKKIMENIFDLGFPLKASHKYGQDLRFLDNI